MIDQQEIYIDGAWVQASGETISVVRDSYTEEPLGRYRSASPEDVVSAVAAARQAFAGWANTSLSKRIEAVERIAVLLDEYAQELTDVISKGVGMPRKLAARIQVAAPLAMWHTYARIAPSVPWQDRIGDSLIQRVPVGVVACITPWNYPLHQITGKVAPALLAGCTVVLKPSELAPESAFILARAIHDAGLPRGVFNLLQGTGTDVGRALVEHPAVDMVSFTGSTRAGREIAARAGGDIKRLALELGGKSASIVMPGADLPAAVRATLASCMLNSGQTCSAMTRLLVQRSELPRTLELIAEWLPTCRMGDPADGATRLGPLISREQQARVLAMVDEAMAAGARRVDGAQPIPGQGFFVPPTVLTDVEADHTIVREEVFGPVLCLLPYETIDEAVALANSTVYGLAGAVWGPTAEEALRVASRLRTGQVDVNGAVFNPLAPFGGFHKSGLGRENGLFGIEEFLELRSIQLPAGFSVSGN